MFFQCHSWFTIFRNELDFIWIQNDYFTIQIERDVDWKLIFIWISPLSQDSIISYNNLNFNSKTAEENLEYFRQKKIFFKETDFQTSYVNNNLLFFMWRPRTPYEDENPGDEDDNFQIESWYKFWQYGIFAEGYYW